MECRFSSKHLGLALKIIIFYYKRKKKERENVNKVVVEDALLFVVFNMGIKYGPKIKREACAFLKIRTAFQRYLTLRLRVPNICK